MGWIIALASLTALACLPLVVILKYDESGPLVRICVGPVPVFSLPSKKEKDKDTPQKKEKKEAKKKGAGNGKKKSKEASKKKGGSLLDFLPLVSKVLDLLGDLGRKLRVQRLELKLIMAGDDPCDLAVNYGRAWAAVGDLFPLLERCFVIKKRDIAVECDFTAEETLVKARVDISITLGRVIALLVRRGVPALWELLKITKTRKGGAI